ncbi:class I SAM-dependent methyltransferase [Gammaproteobacteria bacterium]|nr:class I SAM-dependent methyltransferase [Gammaproteobacteria bacterium]
MIKNFLKAAYRKQQFKPGWLGIIVNPFYIARRGLAREIELISKDLGGRILDVGCGSKPYRSFFSTSDYVGLDIESDRVRNQRFADYTYDGETFPFENNLFDVVICNQVLEHVFNPDQFLSEIFRVLKPDGKILLTVPFAWDEHEQPIDYARYSSFGMRALLEKNKFKILIQKKIGADATVLFQLVNGYFYKISENWPALFKYIFTFSVMASVNILAITLGSLLPNNEDFYLDNIVLAEKAHEFL